MKLLSVNVSLPKEITDKGKTVRTGIFKKPVNGRVKVKTLNIEGDSQADLVGHGGEFRAVYVYSFDHYAYWARELGRTDFKFGQFGENFTVERMLDEEVHVGDVFRIGTALFEVTQPRVPCYKLAIKMGVEGFYNQILESGRLGFYFRVLEEGEIGAGDTIERTRLDPNGLQILNVNRLMYFDKDNLDGMKKALRVQALSPGWKSTFEGRIAKAKVSAGTQEQYRTLIVDRKVPESQAITSFYLVPEDRLPLSPFLPGAVFTPETGHTREVQTCFPDLFLIGQPEEKLLSVDHQEGIGAARSTGRVSRGFLHLLPRQSGCRFDAPGKVP